MNPWQMIFHPSLVARRWIRRQADWTLKTKLELDWFPYPHYAYCMSQATIQAKRLGLPAISAIEIGVGSGDGLIALEQIAAELTKEHGIPIQIIGFDVSEPSPAATDVRDLPYLRDGDSDTAKDGDGLATPLAASTLVVAGAVKQTVPGFLESQSLPPVGFVSFNLGDYTRTTDALRLFDGPSATRLPRTFTCFNNVIGDDNALHCEFTGELLAINEFNRTHEQLKLGKINGLRHKRVFNASWCEHVYVLHDFGHADYAKYAGPAADSPVEQSAAPTTSPPPASPSEASRSRPAAPPGTDPPRGPS